MLRPSVVIAWAVACWGVSSSAVAQPPRVGGRDAEAKPPATVVARVNVNVTTDVDVMREADAGQDSETRDEQTQTGKAGGLQPNLVELVEAIRKQTGSSTGVLVIADINVNVATSIRVGSSSAKPSASTQRVSGGSAETSGAAKPEADSAPDASVPPRKKRKGKRGRKPAEASATEPPLEAGVSSSGITLDRLKMGDPLEIEVSRQVDSEQRAREIADLINARKSQSLVGVALAGAYLPEEAQSLRVVQRAIASLKAEATGNELSISAAIPRETPSAIRTLVEAAIRN